MTAQEMLLNYAKNNNNSSMTNQAWLGQAITEGIVKSRSAGTKVIVNIKREGKTITVTETTVEPTPSGESRTSKIVLVVTL